MGDFLFLFFCFLSFRASITYVRRHLKWNVFSFLLPLCVFNVFCIETAYAMEAEAESETDSEASVGFANDQLVYKGLYLPLKTSNSLEYPFDLKKLKGFEDDFTFTTPPLDSGFVEAHLTPLEFLSHENFSGYIRFRENWNNPLLIPIKSLESINFDDTVLTEQQIVNLFQSHCSCFREKFSRWYEFVNQVVLKSAELQELDLNSLQLITKTNQQLLIKSICETQQFKNGFVFEERAIDNTVSSLSTLSQNLFPALKYLEDRCFDTTTSQTNDSNPHLVFETRRLRQLLGVANLSLVENALDPNVLYNLPNVENVPNPPQIGNEKGCYITPMSLDPNSKDEIILQFHLPGTNINDEMLNRLPFSYNVLNYDSDLQTINFSQQLNTLTLENLEKRESFFLNEHHFEDVAVMRAEGFIRVFPVIPVLNSPQNLLNFNLCQQNAAHVLESHFHFLQFLKNLEPWSLYRFENVKLEQIFQELNVLNRTILLNTLDLTHTLYLHQLKNGLDAICPSTTVFNTLIEYSKMFNPNFMINENVNQNLNLSLPEHQEIFNQLFSQVINLETQLNEPFQANI
jgi:hypothetical protein